jgi:hypothetical protein
LKSGKRLTRLLDAANLLTERFQTTTRNDPLEHAIALLLRAAETRARAEDRVTT